MTDNLNQDFLEFIEFLEKRQVRYLVVGGYAVGLHGFPRYTGDIDFFIAVSAENAARMMVVFLDFGFGGLGLSSTDFLLPDSVIEIGREPRKIQILTGIDWVDFESCYENRITVPGASGPIHFIGKADLMENKRASGRPKDLLDVAELSRNPLP